MIEALARLPVDVELASEFRYRDPILGQRALVIAISQSGETADTLAALRLAKDAGARILSVCNVVSATIPRHSDDVIYTHAGPEIGVASTKAFTTQVVSLYMLAVHLGQVRGLLADAAIRERIQELVSLPALLEEMLREEGPYEELARAYANARNMLYLGRGVQFPIALEGALKLKEISYIHAEGYAAGEMKHGPIALIDEEMPTLILIPKDRHYEKTFNGLAEIAARNGPIIAVASESDDEIAAHVNHVVRVPDVSELVMPIVTSIPIQLFAYYVADLKGTDVDQPRNLAKSVTVE
jgi:glucosamine--fructose-6-phosphate aminotransferase (isomerizing)